MKQLPSADDILDEGDQGVSCYLTICPMAGEMTFSPAIKWMVEERISALFLVSSGTQALMR